MGNIGRLQQTFSVMRTLCTIMYMGLCYPLCKYIESTSQKVNMNVKCVFSEEMLSPFNLSVESSLTFYVNMFIVLVGRRVKGSSAFSVKLQLL